MGVFDDHKLEQLDWMTQMTETIESDLNGLLAKLPDRVLLTARDIIKSGNTSYMSLSVRDVVRQRAKTADPTFLLSWEEETILFECFEFQCIGETEIDLRTETLTGEIMLVKTVPTIADEALQRLMGRRGVEAIGRSRDYMNASAERLNEILDMLGGCEEALKSRSIKNKVNRIRSRLDQIFKTNEWRIRDMKLADKVGLWINGYVRTGNLADLTNFCKLKVMTHTNMPIYSVKEEQ